MVLTQLTKKHLQEKQDDSDDAEVHVKIFVEFHESIEAKKAKNGLDGRYTLEFFLRIFTSVVPDILAAGQCRP